MKRLLHKYLGNIFFPLIWTLFIVVLLSIPGTMLPSEQNFSVPQSDKLVHIGLFAGFVLFWNFYLSRRPLPAARMLRWFFLIFILGNALGIGMEFAQKYLIPFRDFDTEDIIADMIGAGLGYGLSNVWWVR